MGSIITTSPAPCIRRIQSKNKQRMEKAVKGNSVYFFYLYQILSPKSKQQSR
jgi:hypothetical protein